MQSISWEISIIGLSLSVFTLANIIIKSDKHKTDLLLISWLIILNVPLVHTILTHLDLESHLFNMSTNPSINLLQGTILYAYVTMLITEKATFRLSLLLHLLPFMLFYLLFINLHQITPAHPNPAQIGFAFSDGQETNPWVTLFKPLIVHFGAVNIFIFTFYSVMSIVSLLKHQRKISTFFSQKDNQISLKWIYSLPAVFIFLLLLNIINENNIGPFPAIPAMTLHLLSYLSFIVLLCFFGVKQKPVFAAKDAPLTTLKTNAASNETPKVEKIASPESQTSSQNGLDESLMSEIIVNMQHYMHTDKPYLEPDFSVYHLADALQIPRRTLSHVLNNGLSKNFFQYVNEYRIEEVKAQLLRTENRQSTILDLAFNAGFKSKSSFNSLFKQHCKITPSQYRKMCRESS